MRITFLEGLSHMITMSFNDILLLIIDELNLSSSRSRNIFTSIIIFTLLNIYLTES